MFLDRDVVFESRRARHRAKWLYAQVNADIDLVPELPDPVVPLPSRADIRPFPRRRDGACDDLEAWYVVAECAENYPKLLIWLAEGQVRGLRNVFGSWVAVLRLVPGLRWLLWHYVFEPIAGRAPWRPALYETLLQQRRYAINQRDIHAAGDVRLGGTLTVSGDRTHGLSAVTDMAVITPTRAREHLRGKVVSMTAGCIGVSGLRGSGKTTLIGEFCAHRYGTPGHLPAGENDAELYPLRGMRLVVNAPLRFDAREFLIYLYTCLCRAVLSDVRFNTASITDRVLGTILLPRTIRPAALAGSLSGLVFLVLSGGLAYQAYGGTWPVPTWHDPRGWEVLGAVAALIAALIAVGWRTRHALIEVRQVVNLAADAEARLQRLHFQRTDTRSHGGSLSGPMGTGLSIGATRELAEQAMSLPELIDDYRDFAGRVVAALVETAQSDRKRRARQRQRAGRPEDDGPAPIRAPAADVRLIIGIDQMDQIEDPQAACKFLDELSTVFGTRNCVYLLAISPGTLAAVDQRAIPLKTASGGLFDEMVWVESLTLPEAAEILDKRVTGLPAAFIALCYVLSGGLPREVLRIARAVFSAVENGTSVTLAQVTDHVIAGELHELKHRTLASAASLDVGANPGLLEKLTSEAWPWPSTESSGDIEWMQSVIDEVTQLWTGTSPPISPGLGQADAVITAEVCDSFLAGLYYLLTVRQIFAAADTIDNLVKPPATHTPDCSSPESGRSRQTGQSHPEKGWLNDKPPILCDLASARAALGVNPYLATALIHQARQNLPGRKGDPGFAAAIQLRFLSPASRTRNLAPD